MSSAQIPSAITYPPGPPSRRDLRACLFWCSRWLIGGGQFHRGPICITIGEGEDATHGAEQLTVRPKPGDELYTSESGPGGSERAAGLASRLLASLVSEEGLRVWRCVVERGPIAAKNVPAACGVERSRCYVLLTDLRDRGLIADHGEGYELADRELWEAIGAGVG